jgi:hypothetical protein
VKLWEVSFAVTTIEPRSLRTHTRRLLVSAEHEYAAREMATPLAALPRMDSCRWQATKLVGLPLDLSELETPQTERAAGRGYQAGYAAGLAAGYVAGRSHQDETA